MIRVIEDVLGTRIGGATVDGNRVAVRILREPITRADWTTHDYNVHFSFGVENTGTAPADVEIGIEGGRWDDLPDRAPLLYIADRREGAYAPAALAARTDLKRYAIRLPLAPGERAFIANTLIRDPAAIAAACEAAALSAGARREVYGRSLQGRDLVAYHLSCAGTPRSTILITSGFHQAEADTLATEAILRWLATAASASVRSKFDLVVVPIVNPDGFAIGTQGSNAADVNIYWWFARDDAARCPEAGALWRLVARLAPVGYIDFHAYTVQLDKDAGPYLKPLDYYRTPAVREAAAAMQSRLMGELRISPLLGFGTIAPSTLSAMLTREFDTLTLAKYHLHLKHGVDHYGTHGVAALEAMADALHAAGVSKDTRSPLSSSRALMRAATETWAGFVRPALGQLRRGRVSIPLTRNALISPR